MVAESFRLPVLSSAVLSYASMATGMGVIFLAVVEVSLAGLGQSSSALESASLVGLSL
jgi:hypothetical protein